MVLFRRIMQAGGVGSFTPEEVEVFHGAKAYHDTTVNWSDGDVKAFPLNSEEFDSDGYHSTSSNTSRMTVPSGRDGYYWCHAGAYVSGDPAQDAPTYILKNYPGTGSIASYVVRGSQFTPYTAQPSAVGGVTQVDCLVYLAEGDYVEAFLYVDNDGGGGSFPVGGTANPGEQMTLSVALIGS